MKRFLQEIGLWGLGAMLANMLVWLVAGFHMMMAAAIVIVVVTLFIKRRAMMSTAVNSVVAVALMLLAFAPLWWITTEVFADPAKTLAGGFFSVVVPMLLAFQYASSRRKGRYHVVMTIIGVGYLMGALYGIFGVSAEERATRVTFARQRVMKVIAWLYEGSANLVTNPAKRLAQQTQDLRQLRAALTDYQEVYAKAVNWPAMRLTTTNSPIYQSIGDWHWEELLPGSADEDQFVGKATLTMKDQNGDDITFRPKAQVEMEALPEKSGSGQLKHWDMRETIWVNPGIRLMLPGFPTSFVPASQRMPSGRLWQGWVYSSDVYLQQVLPPEPWSINLLGGGTQHREIFGGPAEVLAVHRVALQAGQTSQLLHFMVPAVSLDEKSRYTWGWVLSRPEECTLKCTVNGNTEIYPPGTCATPDLLKRVWSGDLQVQVELPATESKTTVEFTYYRKEKPRL